MIRFIVCASILLAATADTSLRGTQIESKTNLFHIKSLGVTTSPRAAKKAVPYTKPLISVKSSTATNPGTDSSGNVTSATTALPALPKNTLSAQGFYLNNGPGWWTNPQTFSCQEACAHLFGGSLSDYHGSISNSEITHTCYYHTYGYGGQILGDDQKNCAYYDDYGCNSAYVEDGWSGAVNWCHGSCAHTFDVSTERGYLLEFTRTNDDCSGRVMAIAGVVTGSMNLYDSGVYFSLSVDSKPTKGGDYKYSATYFNDLDGLSVSSCETGLYADNQCSLSPDYNNFHGEGRGFISTANVLTEHGGYSYARKYAKGGFEEAVSSVYSAAYELHYDSLIACQLSVQPIAFFATLVKGECYFNPALYGLGTEVHAWVKVLGFDREDQTMTYSIHNNDDCEDQDPYKKAPKEVVALSDANTSLGYNKNSFGTDCEARDVGLWVKYTVF